MMLPHYGLTSKRAVSGNHLFYLTNEKVSCELLFHVLSDFDEGRRSCRRKLERHNNRRRRKSSDPKGSDDKAGKGDKKSLISATQNYLSKCVKSTSILPRYY
nr:squamosa promoter-binding-like protein 7 [Tanacetum cinerariifolium]